MDSEPSDAEVLADNTHTTERVSENSSHGDPGRRRMADRREDSDRRRRKKGLFERRARDDDDRRRQDRRFPSLNFWQRLRPE